MTPSEIVAVCCDLYVGESVMLDDAMIVELKKRGLITKYSDHYVLSAAGQMLASRVSLRDSLGRL